MVKTPVKAVLFLVGGTAAAGTVGYVTGVFEGIMPAPPAMVAALPDSPQKEAETPAAAAQPGEAATSPQPAPAETEPAVAAAEADEVTPPSFDIVRVEPDGSVVIAGKASSNGEIEILAGVEILAKAVTGADGDFVVVLDDRLKPGDYQVVLRDTTPENHVVTSVETAIISVPDAGSGQVLALVEEPGKPSRLITVPEAETPAAEAEAAPETAADETPAPDAETPVAETPVAEAEAAPETAAAETPEPAAETPVAEAEAAPDSVAETTHEPAAAETPEPAAETPVAEAEAAPDTVAESTPEAEAETPVAEMPETEAAPGSVAETPAAESPVAEGGQTQDEVAVARADPAAPVVETPEAIAPKASTPPADTSRPTILVEAVEIEGRTVFVAGRAEPGMTVRVYANDVFLGETQGSDGGRFLIEVQRDLPVGDYIIRADLLDRGGREVAARAAVPFQREEGDSIAAVAPVPGTPAPSEPARPEAPPAAAAEPSPAPAPAAPAVVEQPASETPADREEAGQAVAAAPATPPVEQAPAAAAPAGENDITAPKLQSVQGGVIIRRGDSLWRISRRVYGRGIRYSTIYVANQDQIADPNRIWPGQIFRLPGETAEGDHADLDAIGDQKTVIEAVDGVPSVQ